MNIANNLQNMNISDLRFICREVGITYNKNSSKKSIIKKLLEPLGKKYKMEIVKFVEKTGKKGIDITAYAFNWVNNVTHIIFPGNTKTMRIARKMMSTVGIVLLFIHMYYARQMLSLGVDVVWNDSGNTVKKAITEIISEIMVTINNEINANSLLESTTCYLLQPEDINELKDFVNDHMAKTSEKTLEYINDEIAMLDDSIMIEKLQKDELKTLLNYKNYIGMIENMYGGLLNKFDEKLLELPAPRNFKELPAPEHVHRLQLPAPNPCNPYTPDCEYSKNILERTFDETKTYTNQLLNLLPNPMNALRQHCKTNARKNFKKIFTIGDQLGPRLKIHAQTKAKYQIDEYNRLKEQQLNLFPFTQTWAMFLIVAFIIQKIFGLKRRNNNSLTVY